MTSATDANGKNTSWGYTDPNYRCPTSATNPANAATLLSYYTGPTASESALNFNGTASTADSRATLDGLGRLHVSQTKQSQTATTYDSVETDYDPVGKQSRVTVPYSTAKDQTSSNSPPAPSLTTHCPGPSK